MRIVRKGHALEGQELPVLGRCKRAGQLHLLLILPGQSRSYIPASWTDLKQRMGAAAEGSSTQTPSLLATVRDLFNARIVIDALLGRMADAKEIDDATRTAPASATPGRSVAMGANPPSTTAGSHPALGATHRQDHRRGAPRSGAH